jgi:hypothetical protein
MAHEPDHQQVEPVIFDQTDYHFGHMSGNEMGLDTHARRVGASPCRGDNRCEAMICLVLLFCHLVDAGRKARQFLDRHHVKLGGNLARHFDRGGESLHAAW